MLVALDVGDVRTAVKEFAFYSLLPSNDSVTCDFMTRRLSTFSDPQRACVMKFLDLYSVVVESSESENISLIKSYLNTLWSNASVI